MKAVTHAARILLGLVFFIAGVNVFLQVIPMPPMPPPAERVIGGLASSGYFFPLLGITETLAGAALLARRFVPLALAVLAPLILNICLIHLFLAPSGLPLATVLLVLELFLAWSYRSAFAPLLRARDEAVWSAGSPASSAAG
jgi:putative oxidoreductase